MAANNLYFPGTDRTYSFTEDSYVVIDDKKTGLPLKISIADFFNTALALNIVSNATGGTLDSFSETFDIDMGVPYILTVPTAVNVISVALFNSLNELITPGVLIYVSGATITFEANANITGVTAKIIFSL